MTRFSKIALYALATGLLLIALIALLRWPDGRAVECVAGFDFGSSGVRVGSSVGQGAKTADFAYLDHVRQAGVDEALFQQTINDIKSALDDAAVPPDCQLVAGGYSAWREALASPPNKNKLIAMLARIHEEPIRNGKGVPFYVIPIAVEGKYGYLAAKQTSGIELDTPFIWDIGGGSMQFGSDDEGKAWGGALGQNAWRAIFCEAVKKTKSCQPNPVGSDARSRTAAILASDIAAAKAKLGSDGFPVTAVSAPVVKAMYPIVKCLAKDGAGVDAAGFSRGALDGVIDQIVDWNNDEITEAVAKCDFKFAKPEFVETTVTNMLLVDAFMEGLALKELKVANADINNVKGIIEDQRAWTWTQHYDCYLQRLKEEGVDAYAKAEPAACP